MWNSWVPRTWADCRTAVWSDVPKSSLRRIMCLFLWMVSFYEQLLLHVADSFFLTSWIMSNFILVLPVVDSCFWNSKQKLCPTLATYRHLQSTLSLFCKQNKCESWIKKHAAVLTHFFAPEKDWGRFVGECSWEVGICKSLPFRSRLTRTTCIADSLRTVPKWIPSILSSAMRTLHWAVAFSLNSPHNPARRITSFEVSHSDT